jgi:hypothetical protein
VIAVAHSVSGIFLPLLPERCAVRRLVLHAGLLSSIVNLRTDDEMSKLTN